MGTDEQHGRPAFELAWTEVQQGWRVIASDGTDIGKVEQGVGDRNVDVFEGFEIDIGLSGPDRFVSYEHVAGVSQGRIVLDLTPDEARNLPEHTEVPSLEIDSVGAGPVSRAESGVNTFLDRHADDLSQSTDDRPGFWRRLLGRSGRR
jgi:hypothetical protein